MQIPAGMRQELPLVTVLMAVYNQAEFVRQAVDSALGQTFTNLQVIVINDGSADGTGEVLRGITDPRLRVVEQANTGPFRATNRGLRLAVGRYIAFLDGDDVWLPEMVAEHVGVLESRSGIDLTFSSSRIITESGDDTGHIMRAKAGPVAFRDLLIENLIGNGSAAVVRREALERGGVTFDTTLGAAADSDFWVRVALLRPNNVWGIPRVLTLYRRRQGQMTKDWRALEQSHALVLEKMRRLAPSQFRTVENCWRASRRRFLAVVNYEQGDYGAARRLLFEAFRKAPLFLLRDHRAWSLAAALVSAGMLPQAGHRALQRTFRTLLVKRERRRSRPTRCTGLEQPKRW